ncbi:MAG: fibronectin type III domain-containing protein, partial [Bdellovibrionota bacterium]
TGALTTATINVGLSPSDLTLLTVSDTNSSATHLVTISGLNASTQYYFQVTAIDANGVSRSSGVILKTTKP